MDSLLAPRELARTTGSFCLTKILQKSKFKHFFVYQNYLFDHYADPEIGGEFEHGFYEGYDYALVDGEPVFTSDDIPGGFVNPVKYTLTYDGARIPSIYIRTLASFADGTEPETPFEKKNHLEYPEQAWDAAKIVVEQEEHVIPGRFVGAPTATMEARGDTLDTMISETFTKIIYGESAIEEFDSMVERWKSSGGDDVTAEVNEWFESIQ